MRLRQEPAAKIHMTEPIYRHIGAKVQQMRYNG
jgi:hypothetical protein